MIFSVHVYTYEHIHNRSLQPFSQDYGLVSYTTHVVYVNFIHERRDLDLAPSYYYQAPYYSFDDMEAIEYGKMYYYSNVQSESYKCHSLPLKHSKPIHP